MLNTGKHSYLNTRVSTMTSRLRNPAWFDRLLVSTANDVPEVFNDLAVFTDNDTIEPKAAETWMLNAFLEEFKILLRPLQGQGRHLLMQWIRRVELRNLKTLLHGALLHTPAEQVRAGMLRMGDLETLPFKELLQADDIMEMLRVLDKTSYASMSRQARRLFELHNDPFFVNASIDQRYFNDQVNSINQMPDTDKLWLSKLQGLIIDRHNLIWLLRYRFTYKLKSAETWYLLSPGGLHLSSTKLYSLVNLDSVERIFEQLPGPLIKIIGDNRNLFDVELALENAIEKQTWDILKQQESMVARVLAWLILREKQLLRVRGILKGKRLSLEPDLISYAMGLGH